MGHRFAVAVVMGLTMCTVCVGVGACGSDDDEATRNEVQPAAPYAPVSAAPQPPLAPGAGPRAKSDAATPPPPPNDAAPQDAASDSPADTGTD